MIEEKEGRDGRRERESWTTHSQRGEESNLTADVAKITVFPFT